MFRILSRFVWSPNTGADGSQPLSQRGPLGLRSRLAAACLTFVFFPCHMFHLLAQGFSAVCSQSFRHKQQNLSDYTTVRSEGSEGLDPPWAG